MVRRSHRDGLGSASQAPRDRASSTNGVTDVPVVGQRCGTQRPGPGPVTAWPVMAGGGVWVCSVTLTWFLLVWGETQEPGLRVMTCSGGLDLHDAARWKAAAAAWERRRPEGGAHGDKQAEGLQPEWKQQRVSSGAWCIWSPQSASVLPKTAGHSSRQRRRRGRSVTRELSGTVPSPAPLC